MEKTLPLYKELLYLKIELLHFSETISTLVKSSNYEEASKIDKKRKIIFFKVQELQLEINALKSQEVERDSTIDFTTTFENINLSTIPKIKEQLDKLESIAVKSDEVNKQIEILNYLIH